MGRFTDQLYKEKAIEDSLTLAKSQLDSTNQAIAKIQHEKAVADSTAEANTGKIPEEEKVGMIQMLKRQCL